MKRLAPAKINLCLRIVRRRADGFHDIETLMIPLALADEIEVDFGPAEGGAIELSCSDPSLPTGAKNLAFRAAELFREAVDRTIPPIQIKLEKHIPHGAGLGGGSSDAAAVLLALNELAGTRWPIDRLAQIAATLGSDVAFFLYESAAICRGRGEVVAPVPFPEEIPLLLLKPPFPVPTPWAYQHWQNSRELPGIDYAPQPFPWGEMVNDLERPVFEKYLVLAEMKSWLRAQPEVAGALMSGSGSTVLAILHEPLAEDCDLIARAKIEFGELWTCLCATKANGTDESKATRVSKA